MAAQAALIADTITGMKRALRRERDDNGPDDPIMAPTNRGNKMHANAKYVSEGAMGYINAEEYYKQKIDHAGYTRYILRPNPTRYDSEGDELDEDDEDSEADAAAAEENPFSGIALESLLCPLKHPSELPTHPSMSQPYTSQALEHMASAVEHKLRQERALLWRARNLHRQFLGDSGWMPCGALETPNDYLIFDSRPVSNAPSVFAGPQGPSGTGTPSASEDANGLVNATQVISSSIANVEPHRHAQNGDKSPADLVQNDVEMAEAPTHGEEVIKDGPQLKSEDTDATVKDLPPHPKTDLSVQESNDHAAAANSSTGPEHKPDSDSANLGESAEPNEVGDDTEQDLEMQDGSSPEPPRRMTTRAQANAVNPTENGSPLSSTDTAFPLPAPHPLFLVPDHIRPDPNFGLPAAEAEETRRLLWSYIQKQEETVRGVEHMLDSLNKACRMKADVLEWCKAEGHVGEMSDGEDWYDREQWGLAEGEDLKKGTDEDEVETVDETRTQGKRGRGRRQ